jgi:hypothetical protein
MVAQMLQTLAHPQSPWTASAALFISLSLSPMAVITALHNTIFLNCVSFHSSLDAKLKRIFGQRMGISGGRNGLWDSQVWLATFMYGIPQVLLSFSIISSFVGVGLIAISPLWTRLDGVWDGPQKVSLSLTYWVLIKIYGMPKSILYS